MSTLCARASLYTVKLKHSAGGTKKHCYLMSTMNCLSVCPPTCLSFQESPLFMPESNICFVHKTCTAKSGLTRLFSFCLFLSLAKILIWQLPSMVSAYPAPLLLVKQEHPALPTATSLIWYMVITAHTPPHQNYPGRLPNSIMSMASVYLGQVILHSLISRSVLFLLFIASECSAMQLQL